MGYRDDHQELRFAKAKDLKMNSTLKVSFDFDSTLSRPEIQKMCRHLKAEKYIVTSRSRRIHNEDLFEVADKMEIPRSRIVFTEHEFKADFLRGMDFHFDDDPAEIEMIMSANNGCTAIYLPVTIKEIYQLP